MMPEPASLAAAGNTYNPCLSILRQKGYELWAGESDDRLIWKASKERQAFMAYSPPELLGLVVLWGTHGKDWNQQQPNLVEEKTAAGDDSERSEVD